MNNGDSPIHITSTHSLNRVIVSDAPGLPDYLRGLTGWQLLSAQTHQELVTKRGEREAAREMGERLGWFISILRMGHAQNRKVRKEWNDSFWALWAGIQRILLGGGLVSGPEATLMLDSAKRRLTALGQTCTLELARNPQHIALIGACRFYEDSIHSQNTKKTTVKTTQRIQTVVLDFGGSFLKRGHFAYGGTELSTLELLDALPVDFNSLKLLSILLFLAEFGPTLSAGEFFMRNKHYYLTVLFMVFALISLKAQNIAPQITIAALPRTVEDFQNLRDQHGNTPSGAAALFATALIVYAENQQAGLPMLILMLVNDNTLMQTASANRGYRGFDLTANTRFLTDRVIPAPWVPRSYVQGTSPVSHYTLPSGPLRFSFTTNNYTVISPTELRMFIASTGADTPRPLRLKRNSAGLWKVAEFSSLVVGVRPPEKPDTDDL